MEYDLLKDIEYGGCSVKLSAEDLEEALKGLSVHTHPSLLVDISTHDDAGVYQISRDHALIQTVDFFPPVCSDPYEFGEIAAANALSDVYAMGGEALTALNLMMFPPNEMPLKVLREILKGGNDKVLEAGAVIAGGHTISDSKIKYGLAVTGIVHPSKIITNSNAKPDDWLALTKPVGIATILAGKKIGATEDQDYLKALEMMKQLNQQASRTMQKYNISSATDITGFGLLGHVLKMARGSDVTIQIESGKVPLLSGAYDLTDQGCIPGASFRNLKYVEKDTCFQPGLDYNLKMLLLDAQTSGGILMTGEAEKIKSAVLELQNSGFSETSVIGKVTEKQDRHLVVK